MAFLTGQLLAQAGRIRITFTSFKCYRETWDDILNMDGKGDEVFFRFNVIRADKNGNSVFNYEKRTDVYGDTYGGFSNRINAGSCTNMFGGEKGGIRAGDLVNTNVLLGEYDINDEDVISIIPTAWEHDPIADNSNSFTSTIDGVYRQLNQRLAPIMMGVHLLTGDMAGVLFHGASLGISSSRPAGDQGELGKAGTRPIGMKKNGDFTPTIVAVNTPNMATITNSNFGNGKGVIEVNYNEEALGNSRDHGNYSIFIRIEFVPQSTPAPAPSTGSTSVTKTAAAAGNAAPAPAPAPSTVSVPVKTVATPVATQSTIKQTPAAIKTANTGAAAQINSYKLPDDLVNNVWTGTKDGQAFALRFNPPSVWLMKDLARNISEAAAPYRIADNVFSVTYTVSGQGEIKLYSTFYNATTGELSGVWEQTANPGQKGSWIVKRQR